jgi:hypothetical protein
VFRSIINNIRSWLYPKFVKDLTGGVKNLTLRALLYYKTEPYVKKNSVKKYVHTNNWEITEIVRILNNLGFIVDLIDRSANDFIPEDKYDLFIGLGSGNSGKYFAKYAERLTKAIKILYALGPKPELSNKLVIERYDEFYERTNVKVPPMRTITEVNFPAFLEHTDAIFAFCEKGTFSYNSYIECKKPIYSILPGTSPKIRFSPDWLYSRKRNNFICFAGNGFICKGVDILVETFLKIPEFQLYICGPNNERGFSQVYFEKIKHAPNIHYEGFVTIGSKKFNELASICSWVIFNSASEGCATSVVTCQRAGMVPIVNYESSIKIKDFGFEIENRNDRISETLRAAVIASKICDEDYRNRVYKALAYSQNYTQQSFNRTFSNAIINIMEKKL